MFLIINHIAAVVCKTIQYPSMDEELERLIPRLSEMSPAGLQLLLHKLNQYNQRLQGDREMPLTH